MIRRSRCSLVLAVAASAASACSLGKTVIAPQDPAYVVNGVLNASTTTQVVLLERTLTGAVYVGIERIDSVDPIATGQGILESGAMVQLATPAGQLLTAREDPTTRSDGRGGGVYRFTLAGSTLVPGGVYHLTIRTTGGAILDASTRVPGATAAPALAVRDFDRASSALDISWVPVPQARAYVLHIDSPLGEYVAFTDSAHLRLAGDLRNPALDGLPRVFIPGFAQRVDVAAIDSNYFDYYRSHNDDFSGAGIISRVHGGLGFFGSAVNVVTQTVRVTAPQTDVVEGIFDAAPIPDFTTYFAKGVTVYVESRASRSDQADALSGNFAFVASPTATAGLLGRRLGDSVWFSFLNAQTALDTAETFRGVIHGDTIVGKYSRGAPGLFVRRKP